MDTAIKMRIIAFQVLIGRALVDMTLQLAAMVTARGD
jgi:hypothetical protein